MEPQDLDHATDAATEERAVAQARLAAIVESSDDAIISKTLDGTITSWNAGAQRIFGYTSEQIIGKSILTLIPPDRQHEEPLIISRVSAGERVENYESIRLIKDGQPIDVSVTVSPIKNARGQIIGASKIARDITSSRQLMRELQLAKDAAEAASQAKDQFLSVLSHELRTPLTPVLFSLSSLEHRDDLPPEVRDELAMARRNIESEARLVDDLLDLTRISRAKLKLHLEVVDISRLLRNALQVVQAAVDAKHVDLHLALLARQHHTWGDPVRLQQVFVNLLANAVKFTPSGGAIWMRSLNPKADRIVVEIQDTGIGIEPEVLARLCRPFEQAGPAVSRQFGGLGVGLSIARSLVEMHGGTLECASEGKDRGATFTVGLNAVAAQTRAARTAATTLQGRPIHVLLVEDHVDTRAVMGRLLKRLGCTVVSAGTVRQALSLAELDEFDVLISDIGLPDGSGLEVMRFLRTGHRTKGIALSGYGQDEDLRRSREAGFAAHLTKPINFQLLERTIHELAVVA